jgi:hypothetical protein
MADNSSNAVLGFVVGAIVVAVIVFIFFVVVPGEEGSRGVDVTIEAPTPPAEAPAPATPGGGG